MRENRFHGSFLGLKDLEYRPVSVTTEIVDTDWDEDEILSEIEDDDTNSPRVSLNSVRKIADMHCYPVLTRTLDQPTKRNDGIILRRGTDAEVEPDSRGVSL